MKKQKDQKSKQQNKKENEFIQSPVPSMDRWVKHTANDKDYKLQRQRLDKLYHQDKTLTKSIKSSRKVWGASPLSKSIEMKLSYDNNVESNNVFIACREHLKKPSKSIATVNLDRIQKQIDSIKKHSPSPSKSNAKSAFGQAKMQFVVMDDIFGMPKQIDKNLIDNQKDNYFKTTQENNLINTIKSQNVANELAKQSNLQNKKPPIKYQNISNLNDERPYKDQLHDWSKKDNFESDYDWNQNNVKSMFKSSAGFRIMEDSPKQKQIHINNQIPESKFADKDYIYEKLGIPINAQKAIISPDIIDTIPEKYFEIKESYYHSSLQADIKQEFRNQVIDELEEKREKLRFQRDILMNRNKHIVSIDQNARQLAQDSVDQNMLFEQKFKYVPKCFKEQIDELAIKEDQDEKQKQKFKEDLKPFMQNVENLIENIWEQEKPDLDNVENRILEHRQRMKDVESMYIRKKMLVDKQIKPIQGIYQEVKEEIEDTKKEEVVQVIKKEEQKKVLSLEERDAKRKKIIEEMAKLDQELNKKPGVKEDYIIKPSEKVLKKLDYAPEETKQYNNEFQQFLIDKEINKQYTQQLDNLQKPEFVKFQKTEKQKNNNNGLSISHRAQGQKQQTEEDNLKENLDLYYESLENHKKSDEHRILFKKILEDKQIRKQKTQYKDEEYIIKFLFQEIDKDDGKIVSKQEIYEYISKQKDAIIFFDLCLTTLKIDLENFNTKRLGLLNIQEFGQFIRVQKDLAKESLKQQKIELEKQQKEVEKEIEQQIIFDYNQQIDQGACILDKNSIQIIKDIFQSLQVEDIVEKETFFQMINENSDMMEVDAIQIPYTNRKLKLKKVLNKINVNDSFLTLKQFFNSLKRYQYEPLIDDNDIKYDISQEYLILLRDIFDMTPRITGEIVSSKNFVKLAKSDPQIKAFIKEKVRKQCQDPFLLNETIGDVLERILKQCDDQSNWDTLKLYFSQQGKPLIQDKISAQDYFNKEQVLKDVLHKRYQNQPQLVEIDDMNANFSLKQAETQKIFIDRLNQKPVFDSQEQDEISHKLKEFDQFYKDMKKNNMIYELSPSRDRNKESKPLDKPEKIQNLKDFKVDYDPLFKKMGKKKTKIPLTVPQGPDFMNRPHVETIAMKRLKDDLQKKEEEEKKQILFQQKKNRPQMQQLEQEQKTQQEQLKNLERPQNILKETISKYKKEDVPQVYSTQKKIKPDKAEEKKDEKKETKKSIRDTQKQKQKELKQPKENVEDEQEKEENVDEEKEENIDEEQQDEEKVENIDDEAYEEPFEEIEDDEQQDDGEQNQDEEEIILSKQKINTQNNILKKTQDTKVDKKGGLSTVINKDRKNIDNTNNIKGFFAKEIKQGQKDDQLKDGIAGFFKKKNQEQKSQDNIEDDMQEQQDELPDQEPDLNEEVEPDNEQLEEDQDQNEQQDQEDQDQQQEDQDQQQEDQEQQEEDDDNNNLSEQQEFSVTEAMNDEVDSLKLKLQNIIKEKNQLGGQKVTKTIQLQEAKKLKEKELEIQKKLKELEMKIEIEKKLKEQMKQINEKFQTSENQKQKQARADQKKQELKEKEESYKLQDEQRKKEQQEKLNNRQKLSEKKNLGSNTLAILRKLPSYLTDQ